MFSEAFYHEAHSRWAYAYDKNTVQLRFRSKRADVEGVTAVTGDKYDWGGSRKEYVMEKAATDTLFDYWECFVTPSYKRNAYAFRLYAGEEVLWVNENGIHGEEPPPPAVFYQIMPDRFANGNPKNDEKSLLPWGSPPDLTGHYGGDLQGIIDHLDYISELGVIAVYLTPIFHSPSYHKYDTVDYKQVDPHFGDKKLLKKLVSLCHERGIRVVLDAVFNHCSEAFGPFADVVQHGEASRYAKWFHIRGFPLTVEDGRPNYDTFGFYGNMPKFNSANPEVFS